MESQQPARIHRHVLFGLVALAFGALAVLPAAAAPLPEARVVLNSDRYVVGSNWTLDILVDTPDPLTVKVPVPVLPDSLALSDGPYIRETSWEKVPGTLTRATKVSLTLRTLKPGIVEVGPFTVKIGTGVRTVAPVTVFLLASDEAKRRFPVQLGWVVPPGPFYEGQAIPLLLQARNLDTLVQAPDLGLGAPAGSLWEKAVGLGEIEINSIGEDRLMSVPWGGWMVIPTKPGTLTVPAFQGSVAGLTRAVPALSLDIVPLPPEAAATQAVGDFSYSIDAKEGEGAQDGQLVVTQEISGRGNFPYLVLPEVTVPGLTLLSRQEGTRYRAAAGGYEGSLVILWRFAVDQTRSLTFTLPGFQAFQPTTGRLDVWDPRPVTVAVRPPSSQAATVVPPAKPLDWDGVVAVRPWQPARDAWTLLLFLPGPLFLISTFFFRGKGKGLLVLLAGVVLVSAAEAPPPGFDQALKAQGYAAADLWGKLTLAHGNEPGLWYNKALACRDAGRTAEAVHAFRMALQCGFQGDLAARGLAALEEKELLSDQFVPWTGVPSNWLYLALCLAVNVAFVFWGLQRITASGAWILPLSFAVLVAVGAGLLAAGAEGARWQADAVVGLADGPIRKVPGALAETWMTLKAGTVVKVQGASDRWVLVQTGYGLEGWVEAPNLMALAGGR
jgi:hypothetical protein